MLASFIKIGLLLLSVGLPIGVASMERSPERSPMSSSTKKRVLIICTGNSCRSQLAEALWRHEAGDRWQAFSAGTEPKGINPLTERILKELSISLDGHRSKHVREFAGQSFDLVVTVCDHARETCPIFPGAALVEHWPFDDPAGARGSEEEVLEVFRRVRDQIRQRIREFLTGV